MSEKSANVAIVGERSSGKSLALRNLPASTEKRFHGFTERSELAIRSVDPDTLRTMREARQVLPTATDDVFEMDYQMEYRTDDNNPTPTLLKILDVPGEIFDMAARNEQNPNEITRKYLNFLEGADGAVMLIPAPAALRPEGYRIIHAQFDGIREQLKRPESMALKRVVVALNMFDLFLLPFGDVALDIAADPQAVRRVLRACLRDVATEWSELAELARAPGGENIEVRFMAVSTFGFHPRLGCPNVRPLTNQISGTKLNALPVTDNVYYPYLVADPFVFAATGRRNPYMFTAKELFQNSQWH